MMLCCAATPTRSACAHEASASARRHTRRAIVVGLSGERKFRKGVRNQDCSPGYLRNEQLFGPDAKMADLKALIAEKETAVIKSAAAPGDAAPASITKHVPTIAIADGKATIATPNHGMEEEHWIELLYAKNQGGEVVAAVQHKASDASTFTFEIPAGTSQLTAFEACNKHGVWKSEPVSV